MYCVSQQSGLLLSPTAAAPPGWSGRHHSGRFCRGRRGFRPPRAGCRSWWNTAASPPPGTTAGCRCLCLKCWGRGRTPVRTSADTAGPACTWRLAARPVTAWCSPVRPAGSPLRTRIRFDTNVIDPLGNSRFLQQHTEQKQVWFVKTSRIRIKNKKHLRTLINKYVGLKSY